MEVTVRNAIIPLLNSTASVGSFLRCAEASESSVRGGLSEGGISSDVKAKAAEFQRHGTVALDMARQSF